jgi:hypothetical protein
MEIPSFDDRIAARILYFHSLSEVQYKRLRWLGKARPEETGNFRIAGHFAPITALQLSNAMDAIIFCFERVMLPRESLPRVSIVAPGKVFTLSYCSYSIQFEHVGELAGIRIVADGKVHTLCAGEVLIDMLSTRKNWLYLMSMFVQCLSWVVGGKALALSCTISSVISRPMEIIQAALAWDISAPADVVPLPSTMVDESKKRVRGVPADAPTATRKRRGPRRAVATDDIMRVHNLTPFEFVPEENAPDACVLQASEYEYGYDGMFDGDVTAVGHFDMETSSTLPPPAVDVVRSIPRVMHTCTLRISYMCMFSWCVYARAQEVTYPYVMGNIMKTLRVRGIHSTILLRRSICNIMGVPIPEEDDDVEAVLHGMSRLFGTFSAHDMDVLNSFLFLITN